MQHMDMEADGSSQAMGKIELQLLAYATAKAKSHSNHVCDLHWNSQQCQILNPLSEARGKT